jgi:phenylalanyl-tRNA synthetase beta chain
VFEDVTIGPSPIWLKARLMAAGQRPISNVVDITNYVMLLTGQALHAFDLDRIAGGELTVRLAADGEEVTTLDGQIRKLDDRMVLIADADGPTSIAGVMGGERSEVHAGTTRVLMEAATWHGPMVHHTAWTLGLQSEASSRFEKQLQPEQTVQAQAVAAALMVELCGARLAPGTIDVGGEETARAAAVPRTIRLRQQRIGGLLGTPITRDRAAEILRALEFGVADADDGLDVTVPFFRRVDVTREADLIEEVARIDGLEKLPATLPSRHGAAGRLTERQRLRRRAADALTAQGLHEIVGWSFTGAETTARLRLGNAATVKLANPMSGDQSLLRTTLLSSLLDATARNRARGAAAVRLFEAGAVYLPEDGERLPREPYRLGAVLTGPVRPGTWLEPAPRAADFFAIKGVLSTLLDTLRSPWTVERAEQPFLHPGRSASIVIDRRPAGWIGEIHPLVAAEWELEATVAAFELDLDVVAMHIPAATRYEDVTSFPAVREDLAVIVADTVTAADVLSAVREAGAPLLTDAEVFDVYRDPERVGEGHVSLAVRLTYRAPDRTLTDEEVAGRRRRITQALTQRVNGKVRDA